MVAKAIILTGFKYSTALRANMTQIGLSQFDKDLARIAGRNGLTHLVDPADWNASSGVILDRASSARFAAPAGALPAATTIGPNAKPALQYTATSNQCLVSDALKTETSFSVVAVYEVTSAAAALARYKSLFVSGAATGSRSQLFIANAGTAMQWFANGSDQTKGRVDLVRGAGVYIDVFSYDAATKTTTAFDKNNTNALSATTVAFNTDPINGYSWGIGGYPTFGANWEGKIGRFMVFDRALGLAENAQTRSDLLTSLRTEYGL